MLLSKEVTKSQSGYIASFNAAPGFVSADKVAGMTPRIVPITAATIPTRKAATIPT